MYGCSLGMLDKVGIGTPIPTLFLYFFTWPSLHFDSFVETVKGETKGDIYAQYTVQTVVYIYHI